MSAVGVWAGVICTDLEVSVPWYVDTFGGQLAERGGRWAVVRFADGSAFELYAGRRDMPGLTFPSYGRDAGPPVMPGYSLEEPEVAAETLEVARSLPDWIVVVGPLGLRVVLTSRDSTPDEGLVGFRYASPEPAALQEFLRSVGSDDAVASGQALEVVPVVRAGRSEQVTDPDGTVIDLVATAAAQPG